VPVIQHVAEYDRIINAVKGDVKSKTLAAQFIPPFFGKFADRAEQALNAQLDLVEDENNVVGLEAHRMPLQRVLLWCRCRSYLLVFDCRLGSDPHARYRGIGRDRQELPQACEADCRRAHAAARGR